MTLRRRDLLRLAALGSAVPLLGGCARKPLKKLNLEDVGKDAAPTLTIGDAESELVAGTSRYAFGLADENGPVIAEKVIVYVGRDAQRPPEKSTLGYQLKEEIADRGLYVSTIEFPEAGDYLLAIVATLKGGVQVKGGRRLTVLATSKSPAPGQQVPSIPTPTTKQPIGADPLCSRRPKPCSMHELSLDQALKNGKPTVVVFAAPAFCQTELCGPDVDIVERVAKDKGGAANFIHVEAYRKQGKAMAPALQSFKFETEPWTYFLEPGGTVSDRISGAFATGEVLTRLRKLGVK